MEWANAEQTQTGGLRTWNFQEHQRNCKWNFQGLIKNEVEFPRVFVFGLGIYKGSNTILWNIQGLSFVLSGISWGKVKQGNIIGGFAKIIFSTSRLDF